MIRTSLSCLMSVWKSDEKLLIFAFFISPSKINCLENLYQAFDKVFHHQKKFVKNTPRPRYFQLSSPCFILWWNTASHAYSGGSRPSGGGGGGGQGAPPREPPPPPPPPPPPRAPPLDPPLAWYISSWPKTSSAIQEHCSTSGHPITPNNVKVILAEDNTLKRKI